MPGKKRTSRAYSWKPRGDYSSLAFTPPYPPGESSYTIKGMGYRSFLEDCDRVIPGGRAAVLGAIEQPELREFFKQEFLAGSWFDMFPLPLGREVAARLVRAPVAALMRDAMRYTVKRDAQTAYGNLINRGDAIAILEGLDMVTRQYLNFSPLVRPRIPRPGEREAFRDHVPKVLVPWMSATADGYTSTALELAGFKGARVRTWATPEPDADDGLERVQLRVVTYWDA
jgi:hypothetical protein